MKRLCLLATMSLAACTHPEDRRWALLSPPKDVPAASPVVTVYSFATPKVGRNPIRLDDLTGEGQAAYIARVSDAKTDPGLLRRRLGAPIGDEPGVGPTALPTLDRTLVVSVQKPSGAGVGDRLMQTIVTIEPTGHAFEFAGYTIAATDHQIQDIANLSTTSAASLDVSVAPPSKALGAVAIGGKASRSHTTSADIDQEYQKLNIDIAPEKMVIIREGERGRDVVGNTIVNLTIVPRSAEDGNAPIQVFLATGQELFGATAPKPAKTATIDLKEIFLPPDLALLASVSMRYRMRQIVSGAEYYTEGKQGVALIDGDTKPVIHTLVRKEEVRNPLWGIVSANCVEVMAQTVAGRSHPIVFDNYALAQEFTGWLDKTRAGTIGTKGVSLRVSGAPIASKPRVKRYGVACPA